MKAEASSRPKAILLVEDDEHLRGLLSTSLTTAGYQVHTASNGADGIEILQQENQIRFTVVITDKDMPTACGLTLIQKSRPHWADTKFLLMTGRQENGDDDIADMVVQKPFLPRILLAAIHKLITA